jgi:hypothetical protein
MTTTPTCTVCRGKGTVAVVGFDGRTACPCPSCSANEARAALAREFGRDTQRRRLWRRRLTMRAPR